MHSVIVRLAAAAVLGCSAAASLAQSVTPPPRPPGSNLVRLDAGLQEEERKRYVRAHHHKLHHKRDHTHDDSQDPPKPEAAKRATGPDQKKK